MFRSNCADTALRGYLILHFLFSDDDDAASSDLLHILYARMILFSQCRFSEDGCGSTSQKAWVQLLLKLTSEAMISAGSDLGFPIISLPVEQPWSFDRDENSLPRKEAEVRALRNTIIAPSNQIHPGVDAIVPPRHMIQVTTNVWGHAINGRGLVEAAKVSWTFC